MKNVTHGMSKTREYGIWANMRARCSNKKTKNYHRYGGRGIVVCEEWKTFEGFYADMGRAPKEHSLDRIDNNGNYEPENVKWATAKEQANNTIRNRIIEYKGESRTLAQWVDKLSLGYSRVQYRLGKGMAVADAFTRPTICRRFILNSQCIKVIKYLYGEGVTQIKLAKAHNVARTTIRNALRAEI